MKQLLKDRTFGTLVLTVILIILMGSSRPPVTSGLYPSEYWALKADWHHCADILLVGDSRTLCGLSPEEMQKYFPNSTIYNYGFGGAWFSTQYLDKIETILNPHRRQRTIVMGITPHSLTKRDIQTGSFFEIMSMKKSEKFFSTRLPKLAYLIEPWSFKDAIEEIKPKKKITRTKKTLCPDGWISIQDDPDSIEKGLKKYMGFYKERLVDPCNIDNVVRYVDKWVKQGIKVYGYIPPSCQEMYDLELKISGIDAPMLIDRFRAAGGIWIDTDPGIYDCVDGSHLRDKDAQKFTNDLCRELVKRERPDAPGVHDRVDKKQKTG